MLTNLSWLEPGASWPPPGEKERLDQYKLNDNLFLTKHDKVWLDHFQALARKYKKKNFDVDTIINYHQLLSKKTCDFICGEPPKIETENDTDKLTKLMGQAKFFKKLYEGFIDVTKNGNGVFKFVGKGISPVAPGCWFPVVDPTDLKTVIQDVIAYPISPDNEGKMTELYIEIHTPGKVEIRLMAFDAQKQLIGAQKKKPETKNTGLDVSAVQVLTNLTHSGSIYGIDDYTIINTIIAKIMWRLHCADTILDKHSEPSMSGPESALQYDDRTKMWYVPLANYFKRNTPEDPDIKYVTWDGNLESNFKEIEILFNQLYILTEMGQAFSDAGGGSQDSSGTALKLRMVSPRIKAQRLVGLNTDTVKAIITSLAKLNGQTVDYDTLTLHWCDGLPVDEKELIDTLVSATGNKQVMSLWTALKKRGLSDAEIKEEMQQILDEQAAELPSPVVDRGTGGNENV